MSQNCVIVSRHALNPVESGRESIARKFSWFFFAAAAVISMMNKKRSTKVGQYLFPIKRAANHSQDTQFCL